MKITTNNVPRLLLNGNELTDKEREWFDYMDDIDAGDFFRYRGSVYSLDQFMFIEEWQELRKLGWDGILPDSAFSAVIVKLVDDNDYIIVGSVLA